jgi:pimeloyl-ACP methyl ester carboxylesterase
MCAPLGQEYLRAHRSMKHLADLLARAGINVLRFDYFGTGDSAGEMLDGDLAGWEADIETAIEELKDMSTAPRVGLVGLRLGATLAARVAARRDDVGPLVLWDPLVTGTHYLDELMTVEDHPEVYTKRRKPLVEPGRREVLGFVLSDELAAELRDIDLHAAVLSAPANTHILVSQPLPSHLGLRALRPVEVIAASPAWLENANTGVGAIPVTLLRKVVECFG